MAIRIVVTSDFGTLSRGRHSARLGNGDNVKWAGKTPKGSILIESPGDWQLHSTDGFKRVAKAVLSVKEDGDWEMHGDCRRFEVLEG